MSQTDHFNTCLESDACVMSSTSIKQNEWLVILVDEGDDDVFLWRQTTEISPAPRGASQSFFVNTANGRASKLTLFGRRDKSRRFWCERSMRSCRWEAPGF